MRLLINCYYPSINKAGGQGSGHMDTLGGGQKNVSKMKPKPYIGFFANSY